MIWIATTSVHPKVLFCSAKLNGEFANVVRKSINVVRYLTRMKDFRRPPSIVSELDPKDLSVEWELSRFTAVAVIEAFGRINSKAFGVKACWTQLATD